MADKLDGIIVKGKEYEFLNQNVYSQISEETVPSLTQDDEIKIEDNNGNTVAVVNNKGVSSIGFYNMDGSLIGNDEIIDIASSDKIGIFSTSFMNGYAMENHHHLNHLSMFLDYIIYNHGKSGDDEVEELARLEADQVWLGDIKPSKWNIRYGVVMHQENSGALVSMNPETIYYNSRMLANAIKSLGAQPIFSTEHDSDYSYYQCVLRLCREEGYMFMHWGTRALSLFNQVFKPMWWAFHPSTRTGWMITLGMLPYLQSLPRPNKCIKLFRLRDWIDSSDLNNLLYNNLYERAQRYIELGCGYDMIINNNLFDRLDVPGAIPGTTQHKDEYQKIQNKTSVSFGNYTLAEFITPYDKSSLHKFEITLDSTGITNVYVKKMCQLSKPIDAVRKQAFGVTAGEDKLTEGTSITISGITREDGTGLNKTYVVDGVINGLVITKTASSSQSPNRSSGTDKPICDIDGVELFGSYDYPSYDYSNRYNKPYGEWMEVDFTDGKANLTEHISTIMDYDKISLLFTGIDITIKDIRALISGDKPKVVTNIPMVTYKSGTSVITDTLFDDTTSWTGIESLTTYDNTQTKSTIDDSYEPLPKGITTVKILNKGESTQQSFISGSLTNSSNVLEPTRLQIRIVARYFPKFIDSDEKWETSEISPQSFDISRLAIKFGNRTISELSIGAWWYEYIFETYCTPSQTTTVTLECTDKTVQIARCEIEKISY